MAALSVRCVRSVARASIQISVSYLDKQAETDAHNFLTQQIYFLFSQKTALSTNGVSQSEWLILLLGLCTVNRNQAYVSLCNINIGVSVNVLIVYISNCFFSKKYIFCSGKVYSQRLWIVSTEPSAKLKYSWQKIPDNQKFSRILDQQSYSDLFRVFYAYLEMPSDSKNHFDISRALSILTHNSNIFFRIFNKKAYSSLLRMFYVYQEMSSDSKNYFGFAVDKCFCDWGY